MYVSRFDLSICFVLPVCCASLVLPCFVLSCLVLFFFDRINLVSCVPASGRLLSDAGFANWYLGSPLSVCSFIPHIFTSTLLITRLCVCNA